MIARLVCVSIDEHARDRRYDPAASDVFATTDLFVTQTQCDLLRSVGLLHVVAFHLPQLGQ